MRSFLPLLSLSLAVLSILVDFAHPSPSSSACLHGLCRFDQLYAEVDAQGASAANLAVLIQEDPSNPSAWCTYAELLARNGNPDGARDAFAHAVALGPGMTPVLMRAANFYFGSGQLDAALALSKPILAQTGAFDEVIFSYWQRSKIAAPALLDSALPADQRAVNAWLQWLEENGTPQEVLDTWKWIEAHRLETRASALDGAWALWRRGEFALSQQLWSDWLGSNAGDYLHPQLLFNRAFENQPNGSPFDWTLEGSPSVTLLRNQTPDHGLEVRFAGSGSAVFSGVHQFAAVTPGRYRFAAEIETHDLDRGLDNGALPLFHIFDVQPQRKIDVQTKPAGANQGRSWIALEFNVPAGTDAIEIELERYAPAEHDGRDTGTLHIYQVSLIRD
jgi:hypothetical protein